MNEPKIDFDDYTEKCNRLLRESTSFFSESEACFASYKVDILRFKVPSTTMRLMEYGYGIGRNIPFLRAVFPEATIAGSVISVVSLEIARKDNPIVEFFVEQADTDIDDPCEVVFVAGVLHHIQLKEGAL